MKQDLSKIDLIGSEDDTTDYNESLERVIKEKNIQASVEGDYISPKLSPIIAITKADQSVDLPARSVFEPDEDEMGLINDKALGKLDGSSLTKSDVITLTIRAANANSESDDDIIMPNVLEKLASQAKDVGLPILLASESDPRDHTHKAINTKGIVYDAFVKDNGLFYKAYFPKTQRNLPYIEDILSGLYTKGSVGFLMNPMDYHCSACNVPMVSKECPHQPGETIGSTRIKGVIKDAERNMEYSLVAIPARTESRAVKMSINNEEELNKSMEDIVKEEVAKESIQVEQDLEKIKDLESQIQELKDLILKLSTDRIINDNTILDNTMSEQEQVVVKEDEVEKDGIPETAHTEIEPPVESHQTIEAPHHEEFHKSVIEKLDSLSEVAKNLHDNHLAVLGYMKDLSDKLDGLHSKMDGSHGKHDMSHSKLDAMHGKMDELKSYCMPTGKSFEEKIEAPKVNKSLTPNSLLFSRLHVVEE